jgi:uncharacterized protein (DUF1800 family)
MKTIESPQRLRGSQEALHLFRRAAMGAVPLQNFTRSKAVEWLFADSRDFESLNIGSVSSDTPSLDGKMAPSRLEKDNFKMKQQERQALRELNIAWFQRMSHGQGVLRERMALFWHSHFACRSRDPVFAANYANTLRKHALGNFGEMLTAVSKEPAMLQFLNNQQNRKGSPNENFSREVMELFTIGRGHYTETDVKEGARAFTGWAFDPKGAFVFRRRLHDEGEKNFLGQRGEFDGADCIRILLEQKQTAYFVTEKLYRSLVSEVVDKGRVSQLATDFYSSGYDIGRLLHTIFLSEWFYEVSNKDLLYKSPVELLVGMQRTLGAYYDSPQPILYFQKALGQILFNPPNVAGWPGGRSWIDNSSLLLRMRLPGLIAEENAAAPSLKDGGDDNDPFRRNEKQRLRLSVNWKVWSEQFAGVELKDIPKTLCSRLLACPPERKVMEMLSDLMARSTDRVEGIQKITLTVMSLPEYQVV